jgi:predicted DNA-binding protein
MYLQGDTSMKKAINIRMDEELLSELDAYAKELERPRTWVIEKAVSAYFDTLDEMIADRRIDRVKEGKSRIYTLDEVVRELGLE